MSRTFCNSPPEQGEAAEFTFHRFTENERLYIEVTCVATGERETFGRFSTVGMGLWMLERKLKARAAA
jgi:hypothetical protein